jgi:hypothetical protein
MPFTTPSVSTEAEGVAVAPRQGLNASQVPETVWRAAQESEVVADR